MAARIDVFFLPELVQSEELETATAIVIDVLRATTTIAMALHCGAKRVIPCLEIEHARELAEKLRAADSPSRSGKSVLLAGERHGLAIEGFDLGNSPGDFNSARVADKTVVFTTTNGTRAMQHCRLAGQILIGAFVNFAAVCRALENTERVAIVCAGTQGEISREDVLLAGAYADQCTQPANSAVSLNDQARIALESWRQVRAGLSSSNSLAAQLRNSKGAGNLIQLGLDVDIELAAEIDLFAGLPVLDVPNWEIRLQ